MHWVSVALLLFIFQIATILILEYRRPAKSIAWLLILFIFPIIGFVMYYFLAKEYQRRRIVRDKGGRMEGAALKRIRQRAAQLIRGAEKAALADDQLEGYKRRRLYRLLNAFAASPISGFNRSRVLTNGEETYRSILEAIEQAKHHIHMEYYTIRNDGIGRTFQQALIRKAGEGVEVRIIYDGLGSYKLDKSYLQPLAEAGVELYCFLPPLIAFFDKRVNYRNHRKIVVVDGKFGFLGGINIGDEYLGGNKRLGFWRDTHLRLEGDSVYELQHAFFTDWQFVSGHHVGNSEAYYPPHGVTEQHPVQLLASGPDSKRSSILDMFFMAMTGASERIYITTPYFIPDPGIILALKTAAMSGLDVKVIIPGIPDTRLVHYASLSYLEELLLAGVNFYQYQKGFVHSKVLIVDRTMAIVGTANMDMRSFFSNFELNALLFDEQPIARLESDFIQDLEDSKEIKLHQFMERPRIQKAKEIIARMLSPLL